MFYDFYNMLKYIIIKTAQNFKVLKFIKLFLIRNLSFVLIDQSRKNKSKNTIDQIFNSVLKASFRV